MSLTLDVILPFFIMTSYSFFADIESPCSYIVVRAYTAFFLKYTICLALKSMDGGTLAFRNQKIRQYNRVAGAKLHFDWLAGRTVCPCDMKDNNKGCS